MNQRFTEECKIQAVKQVTEQGYSFASMSDRLGMSTHSLYAWIKKYGPQASHHQEVSDQEARNYWGQSRIKPYTHPISFLVSSTLPLPYQYKLFKNNHYQKDY